MKRIAFYGSSLLSAYWNGAATYYRGLLSDLAGRGYTTTFYEPDAFDRQANRDIEPPIWCRSVVYPANPAGVRAALAGAEDADIVVKASGVGVFDTELLLGALTAGRPGATRVFWDVDAPATLGDLRSNPDHPLHAALPALDAVLTYGGGAPVVDAYMALGARQCQPIYNALDPKTHYPVPADPAYSADLSLLANRLPDREARIEQFFMGPARRPAKHRFLLGGSGWQGKPLGDNVRPVGHVGTDFHNVFNASARAILNVARDSMAETGFSPATRIFEAAGAGACLITDAWRGIELFLKPDEEILVARDGADVVDHLSALTAERARQIGQAALARILAEHTYARRGAEVDGLFRALMAEP